MSGKLKILEPSFSRLPRYVITEYLNVSTPDITDAMNRFGAMDPAIKPLSTGVKMAGQAITVKTRPGDNLLVHYATELGGEGLVLVVDAGAYIRHSVWGGLMTLAAKKKGLEGVVIDGAIRDSNFIRQLSYPVFSKGISPMNGSKEGPGEVNYPIQCGGCPVNPGDLIVGDADGVAVVPLDRTAEVIERAKKFASKTTTRTQEIQSGTHVVPEAYIKKVRELIAEER